MIKPIITLFIIIKLYANINTVTITAQFHLTRLELGFCANLNSSCNVSEVCDGVKLQQWPLLEISLLLINHSAKIINHCQFGSDNLIIIRCEIIRYVSIIPT